MVWFNDYKQKQYKELNIPEDYEQRRQWELDQMDKSPILSKLHIIQKHWLLERLSIRYLDYLLEPIRVWESEWLQYAMHANDNQSNIHRPADFPETLEEQKKWFVSQLPADYMDEVVDYALLEYVLKRGVFDCVKAIMMANMDLETLPIIRE